MGVKRESDLVAVLVICIGEVLDVIPYGLVCSHHGKRLIMYIASYAVFGHFDYDFVAVIHVFAQKTDEVQMSGRGMVWTIMVEDCDIVILQRIIILFYDLSATVQKLRIPLKLASLFWPCSESSCICL